MATTGTDVKTNEGQKFSYLYEADDGTQYAVLLDEDVALAGGFGASASGNVLPSRFKMRRVYYKTPFGKRRSLPVASLAQTVWDVEPKALTVNGENVSVTGRVGEKQTFYAVKPATTT